MFSVLLQFLFRLTSENRSADELEELLEASHRLHARAFTSTRTRGPPLLLTSRTQFTGAIAGSCAHLQLTRPTGTRPFPAFPMASTSTWLGGALPRHAPDRDPRSPFRALPPFQPGL